MREPWLERSPAGRRRSFVSRFAAGVAALALAVAGVVAGLRLAGPVEKRVDLGSFSVEFEPAVKGGLQVYIPLADWEFSATLFKGPLVAHAEPRDLDRAGLLAAARGGSKALKTANRQLEHGAIEAGGRAALWALFGALLAATFGALVAVTAGVSRRRALLFGGGVVAAAVVIIAGTAIAAWRTIDVDALRHPRLGRRAGKEAAPLLAFGRRVRDNRRLEASIRDVAVLLARSEKLPVRRAEK